MERRGSLHLFLSVEFANQRQDALLLLRSFVHNACKRAVRGVFFRLRIAQSPNSRSIRDQRRVSRFGARVESR